MPLTIHNITRYTVQVLTKRAGENAQSLITVRLYDDDNVARGNAVFEDYGSGQPPKPNGDYTAQTATAYLDIAHYPAYLETLRLDPAGQQPGGLPRCDRYQERGDRRVLRDPGEVLRFLRRR